MNHAFITELQALLKKYNASIGWTCGPGSDTHGINGDCIYVEVNNKEIGRTEKGCGYIDANNMPS